MWDDILIRVLRSGIKTGQLHLTLADGRQFDFGSGGRPSVRVMLTDPDLPRKVLLNPEVALGEAYMDGRMTIGDDKLIDFLSIVMRWAGGGSSALVDLLMKLQKLKLLVADWNPVAKSRANVAHHYDLSAELYEAFLGAHKQYTCAYFREPGMTLDQAQAAKMAHIGRKLLIEPGMRVLDIGCGFGTLAIYLAKTFGARVTGVTLSEVQLAEARQRAISAGVADKVEFILQDYRLTRGPFDRVVSVGMMEHVGRPQLKTYFNKVADLLTPDGVALIHYIGRPQKPERISPWFQKYIFPGAYCPSLSEVAPIVEKQGLVLCDMEVWRGHYDPTLAAWRANFDANVDRMRKLTDDRFVRMWRYYLASSEVSFAQGLLTVHQLQLAKRQEAVPVSRDYLYPSSAAREGRNASPGNFAQAQRAHEVRESVDLLGGAGHLEHETLQR